MTLKKLLVIIFKDMITLLTKNKNQKIISLMKNNLHKVLQIELKWVLL
jgi:hypothetical protein